VPLAKVRLQRGRRWQRRLRLRLRLRRRRRLRLRLRLLERLNELLPLDGG